MNVHYTAPRLLETRFNCPHCSAFSQQLWHKALVRWDSRNIETPFRVVQCLQCDSWAVWSETNMVYPDKQSCPLPNPDMPDDVKEDYLEARNVFTRSPRSAAALLRLSIQRLMPHLGEKGKTINDDIASLVKKGLRVEIQQALDTVRVVGNNSVHPGQIDINDDPKSAESLFALVNMIVDRMISEPKKIQELHDKLVPPSSQDAIKKRDGK